ncbi:nucleotidyltransferase domain-containing protein [uncultured Fretibacterium sp.]|uniref:nucleotidyltransferase family protein n=1 Tax=uncultured Fretibacterium sp. TaxID=1678694 RepID=UPI00325FDCCA
MPQSVTLESERERLTKEHIAALVQPVAKKYGIKAIWLFGSRARGDNRPDSDVDLLIRLDGAAVNGFAIGGIYNDLNTAIPDIDVDMIEESALEDKLKNLNRSHVNFKKNVMRERVLLYVEN